MLIDSHCHLDTYIRQGTLAETLEHSRSLGVTHWITVGTNIADWSVYHDCASQDPNIDYTVGLHPCYVEEDWQNQLQALTPFFLSQKEPVALGEIGLDYYHLPKFPDEAAEVKQRQAWAFQQQLDIADQLDCPVIIHSREAFTATVEMIDHSGIDWQKIIFHCFSYGPDEIKLINQRGGTASFTGIITYPSAQAVRDAALEQGINKLILETDCPYLAPKPHRGQANRPGYLHHIAEHCAQLFDLPLDQLAQTTHHNTKNFFRLKSE